MVQEMWYHNRPDDPVIGDYYIDSATFFTYTWTGRKWAQLSEQSFAAEMHTLLPSEEQLEKHPALKQAWGEYLVIKRSIG